MFWVTKDALTRGIRTVEGNVSIGAPRLLRVEGRRRGLFKPDWHATEAEAIARAETMRTDRIASLEKQLAKLKKKKF